MKRNSNFIFLLSMISTLFFFFSCKENKQIEYRDIDLAKVERLNQQIEEKGITTLEDIAQLYRPKDSYTEGNYSYEVMTQEKEKTFEVSIKEEGLMDDSLYGILTLIELKKNTEKKWEAISIKEAYKCWPNRGHQEWSPEFCN